MLSVFTFFFWPFSYFCVMTVFLFLFFHIWRFDCFHMFAFWPFSHFCVLTVFTFLRFPIFCWTLRAKNVLQGWWITVLALWLFCSKDIDRIVAYLASGTFYIFVNKFVNTWPIPSPASPGLAIMSFWQIKSQPNWRFNLWVTKLKTIELSMVVKL